MIACKTKVLFHFCVLCFCVQGIWPSRSKIYQLRPFSALVKSLVIHRNNSFKQGLLFNNRHIRFFLKSRVCGFPHCWRASGNFASTGHQELSIDLYTFKCNLSDTHVFAASHYSFMASIRREGSWPIIFTEMQGCRMTRSISFFPGDALGKRRIARGFSSPLGAQGPHKLWNWHLLSITFAK